MPGSKSRKPGGGRWGERSARIADHEVGGADVLVQEEAGRAQLQGLLDVGGLAGAAAGVWRAEAPRVLACSRADMTWALVITSCSSSPSAMRYNEPF